MRITQQSSTSIPLGGTLTHPRDAPRHEPARWDTFRGPLQWLLEGSGWDVLRPSVDLVLLYVAVVLALGGLRATLNVPAVQAPLLALPPLVLGLLYLRGLYRTRLRALVLDGVVPVMSAVSVAAMAVAMLGIFLNGTIPSQGDWVRGWAFALVAVGFGRVSLALAQRWARSSRRVGKPVLIMGAGLVGSQVARRLDSHPEYGLRPVGFLDDDPRSIAEVGGRDVPVLGTVEDLDEIVWHTGVGHLIVAFSSVADARVSRLIQRCQELGIEVSVVPRMFDTINNRVGYDTVGGLPLMSFFERQPQGHPIRDQARLRPHLRGAAAAGALACDRANGAGGAREFGGPRALPPAPRGPRWHGLRSVQVPPHAPGAGTRGGGRDGRRAHGRSRAGLHAGRRHGAGRRGGQGPPHARGTLPAPQLTG